MTMHELKTWPEPFQAILDGRKTYEIRRADRPFKVGDMLRLREWVPASPPPTLDPYVWYDPGPSYTGRQNTVEVTYITPGGGWGLPDGICVMAIRARTHPPY